MAGNKEQANAGVKAQGMVEFALAIPIVLLIILGIIEAAHLLYLYNAVVVGSREASRFAAGEGGDSPSIAHWQDCADIRAAAKRVSPLLGLQDADIRIAIIHRDIATQSWVTTPVCSTNNPDQTSVPIVNLGDRVTVSVTANYLPLVPLIQFQPLRLSSVSTHTILIGVPIGE